MNAGGTCCLLGGDTLWSVLVCAVWFMLIVLTCDGALSGGALLFEGLQTLSSTYGRAGSCALFHTEAPCAQGVCSHAFFKSAEMVWAVSTYTDCGAHHSP